MSPQGQFNYEYEHRVGDPRDFDIGYIDPVANLTDGNYAALLAEGYFYPSESWFYKFSASGDTLLRKFLMTYPIEDSVTHSIKQIRPTQDNGFIMGGFFNKPGNTQAYLVRLNSAAAHCGQQI